MVSCPRRREVESLRLSGLTGTHTPTPPFFLDLVLVRVGSPRLVGEVRESRVLAFSVLPRRAPTWGGPYFHCGGPDRGGDFGRVSCGTLRFSLVFGGVWGRKPIRGNTGPPHDLWALFSPSPRELSNAPLISPFPFQPRWEGSRRCPGARFGAFSRKPPPCTPG